MPKTRAGEREEPTTSAAAGPRELVVMKSAGAELLPHDAVAHLVEGAEAWRFVPLPGVGFGLVAGFGTALATWDLIAASVAFLLALGAVPVLLAIGGHLAFWRRASELGLPDERIRELHKAYRRARARLVEIDEQKREQRLCEALLEAGRTSLESR